MLQTGMRRTQSAQLLTKRCLWTTQPILLGATWHARQAWDMFSPLACMQTFVHSDHCHPEGPGRRLDMHDAEPDTSACACRLRLNGVQVADKQTMLTKHILRPTSGRVVPGEMMGLVGPSGAGEAPPAALLRALIYVVQATPNSTGNAERAFGAVCCARAGGKHHIKSLALCRQIHTVGHSVAAEGRQGVRAGVPPW